MLQHWHCRHPQTALFGALSSSLGVGTLARVAASEEILFHCFRHCFRHCFLHCFLLLHRLVLRPVDNGMHTCVDPTDSTHAVQLVSRRHHHHHDCYSNNCQFNDCCTSSCWCVPWWCEHFLFRRCRRVSIGGESGAVLDHTLSERYV